MTRHLTLKPADGGDPFDVDLHQMTDDCGPLAPDPARGAGPDWRDDLGERDTFAAEVRMGFPAASRQAVQTPRVPGHQPPAADGRAAPLVCPDCGKSFSPSAVDLSFVRPAPDGGGLRGPGQLTVGCPHCGSLRPVYWGGKGRTVG